MFCVYVLTPSRFFSSNRRSRFSLFLLPTEVKASFATDVAALGRGSEERENNLDDHDLNTKRPVLTIIVLVFQLYEHAYL